MKVYLGEFEDEIDKEIILNNILKESVPRKVLEFDTMYCPICREKIEDDDPEHVSFCRDEQTDMYIYCLKERVKKYNYKALCFLSLLDFSGLRIHPLDLTTIKIINKLFSLFHLCQNTEILYDIFLILNCYNVQVSKHIDIQTFFDNFTQKVFAKSLREHQTILILLKERTELSYRIALNEITELYYVNINCI